MRRGSQPFRQGHLWPLVQLTNQLSGIGLVISGSIMGCTREVNTKRETVPGYFFVIKPVN
ncbi:MAG: hypothetical protein ABI980_03590 [Nitrospirota bacterium]